MLDPAEFLENWDDGAADPIDPGSGPEGLDLPEIVNDPDAPPSLFYVFDIVGLAVGPPLEVRTLKAPTRPAYWLIALDSTANSGILVWQGSGPGGPAIRLGPAGRARIPAQDVLGQLTIQQAGSAASNVTVIAVNGLHAELVRVG